MSQKHNIDIFLEKARAVHGNRYDYSKVEYVGVDSKVCIICSEHGEFWQSPYNHIKGHGCKKCANLQNANNCRLTGEEFIARARKKHGDRFDYSQVNYQGVDKNVIIICKEHGPFLQRANVHLRSKNACPKCKFIALAKDRSMGTEAFIREANIVHNNKYDYSKVEYKNTETKVCIICPEHGEYWTHAGNHLSGHGCPKCAQKIRDDAKRRTLQSFILEAQTVHGDRYDYSKVEYVNTDTKVCITCPVHGDFWQSPHVHIKVKCGCPTCNASRLENAVAERFPNFEKQKTFKWLRDKYPLHLDFYHREKKVAIECQGEPHFKQVWFGSNKKNKKLDGYYLLENVIKRDEIKYNLCKEHEIEVLYYFPKEYLKYEIPFYNDKKVFHTLDSLKKYLENLSL